MNKLRYKESSIESSFHRKQHTFAVNAVVKLYRPTVVSFISGSGICEVRASGTEREANESAGW